MLSGVEITALVVAGTVAVITGWSRRTSAARRRPPAAEAVPDRRVESVGATRITCGAGVSNKPNSPGFWPENRDRRKKRSQSHETHAGPGSKPRCVATAQSSGMTICAKRTQFPAFRAKNRGQAGKQGQFNETHAGADLGRRRIAMAGIKGEPLISNEPNFAEAEMNVSCFCEGAHENHRAVGLRKKKANPDRCRRCAGALWPDRQENEP